MLTLLQKEIQSFLSSLIGYIVISVFLLIIGLMMWVVPGDMNVLDMGQANIDTLFMIAPWVFMFLGPAITMRSFSEEKRTGTIELLLTRPLSDWSIIFAKYLAGFLLVLFSLLPTLFYFITVHALGNPPGNIDMGGMWGSYFGLLFLAGAFVAIGLFASSLTKSQIVSFLVALFLSFACYFLFESVGRAMDSMDSFFLNLGIYEHYLSVSRGVIDTRDAIYFISIIMVFLLATKTVLASRKW